MVGGTAKCTLHMLLPYVDDPLPWCSSPDAGILASWLVVVVSSG